MSSIFASGPAIPPGANGPVPFALSQPLTRDLLDRCVLEVLALAIDVLVDELRPRAAAVVGLAVFVDAPQRGAFSRSLDTQPVR